MSKIELTKKIDKIFDKKANEKSQDDSTSEAEYSTVRWMIKLGTSTKNEI